MNDKIVKSSQRTYQRTLSNSKLKSSLFECSYQYSFINTRSQIHNTSRTSLLNERKKASHEIDLRRKVRAIRLSKTRNIVFNIDSSFKKWSSQAIILQTLKTENQKSSSWRHSFQYVRDRSSSNSKRQTTTFLNFVFDELLYSVFDEDFN